MATNDTWRTLVTLNPTCYNPLYTLALDIARVGRLSTGRLNTHSIVLPHNVLRDLQEPLRFHGNDMSLLLILFIENKVCDDSNVCVPLDKFWHIQRFDTMYRMKPDESPSIDHYLTSVSLCIGKHRGLFRPL